MHLMIGNQAIPHVVHAGPVSDNDGIPDGWTMVVREIFGWYGNIANADSYRASPEKGVK